MNHAALIFYAYIDIDEQFRLPRNNDTVKNAWINEILKHQTKKHFSERMLVCDLHFREDQFIRGCKIKLAIDAVPTVFR